MRIGLGLIFVLAGLASSMVFGGERTVFRGELGGRSVILEVERSTDGNAWQGRYCALQDGRDIPLAGPLNLLREAPRKRGRQPLWSGSMKGDRFSGHRIAKGARTAFSLRKIGTYDPRALAKPGAVEAVTEALSPGVGNGMAAGEDAEACLGIYEQIRFDARLKPGKLVERPWGGYRWMIHQETKIAYPRLTHLGDPKIMIRVNRILESHHLTLVGGAMECQSLTEESNPAAGSFGGFDEEVIQVACFTPQVMSIVESGSTFCGGAHPNNHFEPYVLDLEVGDYLDFSELFLKPEPGKMEAEEGVPEPHTWMGPLLEKGLPKVKLEPEDHIELLQGYWCFYFGEGPSLNMAISGIGHWGGCYLGDHAVLGIEDLAPLLTPKGRRFFEVSPAR